MGSARPGSGSATTGGLFVNEAQRLNELWAQREDALDGLRRAEASLKDFIFDECPAMSEESLVHLYGLIYECVKAVYALERINKRL